MRLLIVSNYFWPENFRINDLAVNLVERGHDVTVLSGIPNYPGGKFYSGYGFFKKRTEVYRGVRVIRFPLIPRGRGGGVGLTLNYLSSAVLSTSFAPFYCRGPYDLIFVCQLSPVTIGLPAILIKKLQSVPILFWILDIWPESLSATGIIRSERAISICRRLVRCIYSQCDQILVSSKGYIESLNSTGGYTGEIAYFPNWVEPEYLSTIEISHMKTPKLPSGFTIMFAGNIGAAQDFETILAAAEQLKAQPDIHWVILGDGRRAEWVRKEVQARGLSGQFHLFGYYPAKLMPLFFAQADAMLVTLKNEPIFALTAPGKLQSYMACGKPIIAGLSGEGKRIIEDAGAGLTCPPGDPVELAHKVLTLYRMTASERQDMGERGRTYCIKYFNGKKLFDQLETMMEKIVNDRLCL